MCRMLIAIGNVNMNSLIDGVILMAKDQNRIHELNAEKGLGSWTHFDGWGIAYVNENDEWIVEKSTLPIHEDPKTDDLRNVKTKLVIIHTRAKIGSDTAIENTHPFFLDRKRKGPVVFCHNGFIDEEIKYDKKKYTLKGQTDSEKLFYSILGDLRRQKLVKAIRRNFKRYKKLSGTNIILATREKSVVAIRENKFPLYYQMNIAKSDDFIVISSGPFPLGGSIEWQSLEQGDIIEIKNKSLEIKIHKKTLTPRRTLSKLKSSEQNYQLVPAE